MRFNIREMAKGVRSSSNGSTERHYLSVESEDLDTAFYSNQVRWHTFTKTKMKALESLDLRGYEFVLDLGCGQGHFLKLLHDTYPAVVRIGIDINSCDLRKAKKRNADDNCGFVLCDAGHLPFKDACFERATATAILEHVVDERSVLVEVSRMLSDGGFAVIDVPGAYHLQNRLSDFFVKRYGVFPFHREYTTRRIMNAIQRAGFHVKTFTTARFEGSFLLPIVETIILSNGRKIVWCKGRLARLVCGVGDRMTLIFGSRQYLKLLGGSWFFKITKDNKPSAR